ncbi:unnamed protein product [Symbiodinium natans]|uniref:Uncharacterized protein n=1 Tax=Symbiodinium natans TaxID=878477 RepID=A0A812MCR4_9DINO|nr:unnamed protein product [Symbiodinium natans]
MTETLQSLKALGLPVERSTYIQISWPDSLHRVRPSDERLDQLGREEQEVETVPSKETYAEHVDLIKPQVDPTNPQDGLEDAVASERGAQAAWEEVQQMLNYIEAQAVAVAELSEHDTLP